MRLVVNDHPDALRPGDVLVKFSEGSSGDEKKVVQVQKFAKFVSKVAGHALQQPSMVRDARDRNPKRMHVAMYVGDGKVVEEGKDGLVHHEPDDSVRRYSVWRYCKGNDTSMRAAQIMRIWAGATAPETGQKEKDTSTNVLGKKIPSLFRRKELARKSQYGGTDWKRPISSFLFLPQIFGSSAPGLFSLLSRFKHKFLGSQGTMVCSEAVIAAYHLAADEKAFVLALNSPIDLDPHRTSPMELQRWLMERFFSKGGHWKWMYEITKGGGAWHAVPIVGSPHERKWRDLWAA